MRESQKFRAAGVSRWSLISFSIVGAAGVIAIAGLDAAQFPSDETRSRWHEFLFENWKLSVSLGLPFGAAVVLYTAYMYRRHREFYARFFAASLAERRRSPLVGRNMLYSLPMLLVVWALVLLGHALEFAPFPGMLAMLVPFPLLIRQSDEVRRDARALWLEKADEPGSPAA
jgi:hypothetical protein